MPTITPPAFAPDWSAITGVAMYLTDRAEAVDRLRRQADWLDAHPTFAPEWSPSPFTFYWWQFFPGGACRQATEAEAAEFLDASIAAFGDAGGEVVRSVIPTAYEVTLYEHCSDGLRHALLTARMQRDDVALRPKPVLVLEDFERAASA